MDCLPTLVRLVGPLALLGFLTSLIGTLLVAGTFRSTAGQYIFCIFSLLLGILALFLSYWRQASPLGRTLYLGLGLINITVGIAAPLIGEAFHMDAAYVNRAAFYIFELIGFLGTLASLWHFVTGLIGAVFIEAAGIETAQETFLYVIWATLESVLLGFFIPLKESFSASIMFNAALVDCLGFWFLGALLAGGLCLLIVTKGASGVSTGVGTKGSQVTSYDTVGTA
jgi:hypothetical protein